MHSVSDGTITPRLLSSAQGIPSIRYPTKVAQLIPIEPGVISARAITSITWASVIQPLAVTSSRITGIIVSPPKLQKPIRINANTSLR